MKTIPFNFSTLISLAALGLLLAACQKPVSPASGPPPPPAVTANQPAQREVVEWDEYPGRLEAVEMVEARARVSGYLQSVHFKDGAEVNKGDLLFVIDPRPYQAEVDRAEASLNQAQTHLAWTSNDLARAERLLKSKTVSEEEADSRSKAKHEAEAVLQSSRASLEMARLNLEYTHLTAPVSGRISRKLVTEGNLINGNQGVSTLLTTIVSLDPIYCYMDTDERALLKYQQLAREGKRASARDAQIPCEMGLANEEGFPHQGVVDFVDNRVDPTTGTIRARGVFSNADRSLTPGLFARLRVTGSGKYPALLIPDQAVGTDQGQKIVYVINDQDTVEYRKVKLGPIFDGLRVVHEGLQAKDWVVVNGLMSIRQGVKVNPNRAAVTVVANAVH